MADTPLIPPNVFNLLHLVEFGARMAGDTPDSDALQKLEPTLEAAARGLHMAWPAIAATLALIQSHIGKGASPTAAVETARDHVTAAVVISDPQQDGGR